MINNTKKSLLELLQAKGPFNSQFTQSFLTSFPPFNIQTLILSLTSPYQVFPLLTNYLKYAFSKCLILLQIIWQTVKCRANQLVKIFLVRSRLMSLSDTQIFIALAIAIVPGVLALRLSLELYKQFSCQNRKNNAGCWGKIFALTSNSKTRTPVLWEFKQ